MRINISKNYHYEDTSKRKLCNNNVIIYQVINQVSTFKFHNTGAFPSRNGKSHNIIALIKIEINNEYKISNCKNKSSCVNIRICIFKDTYLFESVLCSRYTCVMLYVCE